MRWVVPPEHGEERSGSGARVLELRVLPLQVLDDLQELLLLQPLLHNVGLVHDVTLRSSALDGDAGRELVLEELLQKVGPLVLLTVTVDRSENERGVSAIEGERRRQGGPEVGARGRRGDDIHIRERARERCGG